MKEISKILIIVAAILALGLLGFAGLALLLIIGSLWGGIEY
jgi:hypothetical protein